MMENSSINSSKLESFVATGPARKVWVQTFGCQMNVNDSEKIVRLLGGLNFSSASGPEEADLILLNTCSIREKPEQKVFSSLGRLRKYKEARPEIILGVAGCMAQLMGKKIRQRAPYVDLVFGTHAIHRLPAMLTKLQEQQMQNAVVGVIETPMGGKDDFDFLPIDKATPLYQDPTQDNVVRHVTIQNGCNKNCSYCIVPTVRGREISRPRQEILDEIKLLAENGMREAVLVGQTVNSYGVGTGYDFADLLTEINAIDGLQRIRFVTSHPRDLNEKLMHTMAACDKVCEHLHLPMQSGSNDILRQMYRGYTFDSYLDKIEKLRSIVPGISLSSDFIVGFPGESEKDFQATLDAIQAIGFDSLFSFIYSTRPFTKATDWEGQIPLQESQERLQRLLTLQKPIAQAAMDQCLGQVVEVLIEGEDRQGNGRQSGRTRKQQMVHVRAGRALTGELVQVKIDKVGKSSLSGSLI